MPLQGSSATSSIAIRSSVVLVVFGALCGAPVAALAQHDHGSSAPPGWSAHINAQVFLTLNLQQRKFRDFRQVESTNWFTASVRRATPKTRVTFNVMASAEPWTLRRLGSAQVFQEGETLDGLPLRDYQHPHDLLMAFSGRFDRDLSPTTSAFVSAGLVDAPALGPTPFMHRASASFQPTAPLTHHRFDSLHVTHGVVSAGVSRRQWTLDASWFNGREPDEDRIDLDTRRLDSASARLAWASGPWRTQVSNAWLRSPEPLEPGDVTRMTASVEFSRPDAPGRRGRAWTLAVGRDGHVDHHEWGVLAEGVISLSHRFRAYTRVELVDRFILVDFERSAATGREQHARSRIGAWTFGAARQLHRRAAWSMDAGADVTVHSTPSNLRDSYGSPVSWHVYLRLGR